MLQADSFRLGLPRRARGVGASTGLLVGDIDRFHLLFREAHDLPIGRFDLVPLPGLSDVVFRLDPVSGFSFVCGSYFGN